MTSAKKRKPRHDVAVVQGPAGLAVYVNGCRVLGDKPWGGGRVLVQERVGRAEMRRALSKAAG